MSGSLGHPNIIRDFPSRTRRVMRYVAENQTMVRDEGPPWGRRGLRGLRGLGLLQREGSKLEISFKGSESITVEQKSQQLIFRFFCDNRLSYINYISFGSFRKYVCNIY